MPLMAERSPSGIVLSAGRENSAVYYCNACDEPVLMRQVGGVAGCPVCDHVDPTVDIRPLFVVTGASGSGKTTIFPKLLSRATKDGEIDWTAFRDTWVHVAHGVAQNGLPTLLLAPFIPEHLNRLPGRAWVGEIHYLVLDCPDDERRRRMEARPRWRSRDIEAQIGFGRWLRENLAPVIDTTRQSPSEVAETVAAWVRDRIAA
jgi:hypothetical protein